MIQLALTVTIYPALWGEADALEGLPFCPEMYFIDRADMCLYASGWALINGPSYLTDGFLVGAEVEAIEDDYEFVRQGGVEAS